MLNLVASNTKVIFMALAICPLDATSIKQCEQTVDTAPQYVSKAECKAASVARATKVGSAILAETGVTKRILFACIDAERKAEMFPKTSD